MHPDYPAELVDKHSRETDPEVHLELPRIERNKEIVYDTISKIRSLLNSGVDMRWNEESVQHSTISPALTLKHSDSTKSYSETNSSISIFFTSHDGMDIRLEHSRRTSPHKNAITQTGAYFGGTFGQIEVKNDGAVSSLCDMVKNALPEKLAKNLDGKTCTTSKTFLTAQFVRLLEQGFNFQWATQQKKDTRTWPHEYSQLPQRLSQIGMFPDDGLLAPNEHTRNYFGTAQQSSQVDWHNTVTTILHGVMQNTAVQLQHELYDSFSHSNREHRHLEKYRLCFVNRHGIVEEHNAEAGKELFELVKRLSLNETVRSHTRIRTHHQSYLTPIRALFQTKTAVDKISLHRNIPPIFN